MPLLFQLTFERFPQRPYCVTQEFAGSRENYYLLGDGTALHMETTPVWCPRCGRVTEGEKVETVETLDGKIRHYSQWERMPETLAILSDLEKRRGWRAGRKSPPRCTGCGSAVVTVLPVAEKVRHPEGTGWICLEVLGFVQTADFDQRFFTAEGERSASADPQLGPTASATACAPQSAQIASRLTPCPANINSGLGARP